MKSMSWLSLSFCLFFVVISSCKTAQMRNSALATADTSPRAASGANPALIVDKSKPFNYYTWVTAHNAFNSRHEALGIGNFFLPNQQLGILEQLQRGIRGLMLDTHSSGGEVLLCHGKCSLGHTPLAVTLNKVADFLSGTKDAVITIHFEDYVARNDMQDVFTKSAKIAKYVFDPKKWPRRNEWPTLQEMIDKDQRLLLLTQKKELAGAYENGIFMFFDSDITVENHWSIGDTIGQHDYTCKSRWDSIPLDQRKATAADANGWSRLFVMNHFHGAPEYLHSRFDNRWDQIQRRAEQDCSSAQRPPNYIAVDFIEQGDVLEYVEWKNNGGLIAYEGNDASQDVVCGFSTALARTIKLQSSDEERLGCENDEMRSLILRGVKAGQRVTFCDHPDGDMSDDCAVLDIKIDVTSDHSVVVPSFERNQDTAYYRLEYFQNNGLDGKVSNIKVEPNPDLSKDAAIVLYREDRSVGRVSCRFKLESSDWWNLKKRSGCHNDDARSAKIFAAKAGTEITIYDSPDASTDDDYVVIYVKRNLTSPIAIPGFEESYETPDIKVTFHRKNGLNGKVSAVRIKI